VQALFLLVSIEAGIECVFKIIIGSLLHNLGILESLYQLKLLLLHHGNLSLQFKSKVKNFVINKGAHIFKLHY
jgi:hypothetical protein